jgi:ferredoxin
MLRTVRAIAAEPLPRPTSQVFYQSQGCALILSDAAFVFKAAAKLRDFFEIVFISNEVSSRKRTPLGVRAVQGRVVELSGYLGRFRVVVEDESGGRNNLRDVCPNRSGFFDFVIDLMHEPVLDVEVPPLGYLRISSEDDNLEAALRPLPQLTGEVSKPKYFRFDAGLCAHRRRQITGCERCLQVCPTGAITSGGDFVAIDPYLCQGCGTCAGVCPTGAVTYTDPPPAVLLERITDVLTAALAAGASGQQGATITLVCRDGTDTGSAKRSDNEIRIEVGSVGATGLPVWLTGLAQGASTVVIAVDDKTPRSVIRTLEQQIALAQTLLSGMGEVAARVQLSGLSPEGSVASVKSEFGATTALEKTSYVSGRDALLRALDALVAGSREDPAPVDLPSGAPFGAVGVDARRCTMCQACASLCPTSALRGDANGTELHFVEASCIQCGVCERGCPEDAITLRARFEYNRERRCAERILNRVEAARCAQCGQPYLPLQLLRTIERRMAASETTGAALREIVRICPTCRAERTLQGQFPRLL